MTLFSTKVTVVSKSTGFELTRASALSADSLWNTAKLFWAPQVSVSQIQTKQHRNTYFTHMITFFNKDLNTRVHIWGAPEWAVLQSCVPMHWLKNCETSDPLQGCMSGGRATLPYPHLNLIYWTSMRAPGYPNHVKSMEHTIHWDFPESPLAA